jgi:hypothetical protein
MDPEPERPGSRAGKLYSMLSGLMLGLIFIGYGIFSAVSPHSLFSMGGQTGIRCRGLIEGLLSFACIGFGLQILAAASTWPERNPLWRTLGRICGIASCAAILLGCLLYMLHR